MAFSAKFIVVGDRNDEEPDGQSRAPDGMGPRYAEGTKPRAGNRPLPHFPLAHRLPPPAGRKPVVRAADGVFPPGPQGRGNGADGPGLPPGAVAGTAGRGAFGALAGGKCGLLGGPGRAACAFPESGWARGEAPPAAGRGPPFRRRGGAEAAYGIPRRCAGPAGLWRNRILLLRGAGALHGTSNTSRRSRKSSGSFSKRGSGSGRCCAPTTGPAMWRLPAAPG